MHHLLALERRIRHFSTAAAMPAKDESALRVVEIENQLSVQRYLEDALYDVRVASTKKASVSR